MSSALIDNHLCGPRRYSAQKLRILILLPNHCLNFGWNTIVNARIRAAWIQSPSSNGRETIRRKRSAQLIYPNARLVISTRRVQTVTKQNYRIDILLPLIRGTARMRRRIRFKFIKIYVLVKPSGLFLRVRRDGVRAYINQRLLVHVEDDRTHQPRTPGHPTRSV